MHQITLHCLICKHKWTTELPDKPDPDTIYHYDICPECGAQAEPQEEDRAPK